MQYFLIDAQTAQAVANYIGRGPYAEVAGLMEALKGLQPASIAGGNGTPPEEDTVNTDELPPVEVEEDAVTTETFTR